MLHCTLCLSVCCLSVVKQHFHIQSSFTYNTYEDKRSYQGSVKQDFVRGTCLTYVSVHFRHITAVWSVNHTPPFEIPHVFCPSFLRKRNWYRLSINAYARGPIPYSVCWVLMLRALPARQSLMGQGVLSRYAQVKPAHLPSGFAPFTQHSPI